jgi:hypothetical protein
MKGKKKYKLREQSRQIKKTAEKIQQLGLKRSL